jgi:hypothetical protein
MYRLERHALVTSRFSSRQMTRAMIIQYLLPFFLILNFSSSIFLLPPSQVVQVCFQLIIIISQACKFTWRSTPVDYTARRYVILLKKSRDNLPQLATEHAMLSESRGEKMMPALLMCYARFKAALSFMWSECLKGLFHVILCIHNDNLRIHAVHENSRDASRFTSQILRSNANN